MPIMKLSNFSDFKESQEHNFVWLSLEVQVMLVHSICFTLVIRAMGYQIKSVVVLQPSTLMGWPAKVLCITVISHINVLSRILMVHRTCASVFWISIANSLSLTIPGQRIAFCKRRRKVCFMLFSSFPSCCKFFN